MSFDSVHATISEFLADRGLILNFTSILIICIACFVAAGLLRLIFGQKGTAVKSVSATLDILTLYCIVFALQQSVPAVEAYLPVLPFSTIGSGFVSFLPLSQTESLTICIELVDLIVLAFLFGLMEDLLPQGKGLIGWLFFRALSIVIVYVGFSVVNWVFTAILPGFVLTYAPLILLALLILFLAVTVFKWLIGLILGATGGPVIGAIYTFFISNIVGKQLTKAALSSGMIMLLLHLAERFEVCNLNLGILPISIIVLTVAAPLLVRFLVSKLF